ncbi:glycosyltransferase [Candidatus Collierbacteria bacterium]|nr:glycosyltransferase [Candidatus Collierbacteria bacterium]
MKSNNPKVSVILPIGKDKSFLKEALKSIRDQTFNDFELLSQEDDGRGLTQVLIDLVKKAKGEFLARMDADDICSPDRFRVQVEYLESHPDAQLVGSWATLIDENGDKIGLQKMPTSWKEIKKEVFFRNPLIHPSLMMRKSWFEKIGGYNSSFTATQDWEFILRTLWNERIENIPQTLIKLRIHPGSVSFSNNWTQVYFGLKARLNAIIRGDVPWYMVIYLIPSVLALMIPSDIKLLFRKIFIPDCRSAVWNEKILGLVMPLGQNKDQLLKSGQWSLWQTEIDAYKKHFGEVEIFEFKYRGWRRFLEAKLLPLIESKRFKRCLVLKAVHLSAVIPCLIAKLLYGTPYVLSFGYRYDEFALIEKKWLQWPFIKLVEILAVRFADLVLVPTELLEKYVKSLGAIKVEVIPNGVNPETFKGPALLQQQGRALSDLRILFVGRLEEQKNLKTLIEAVSKLPKGCISTKLLLVGTGSQKNELIQLADEVGVNLEVVNQVPNEKLPEIYRQADIFVLPSLAEGHPKALLEAMSCGLACISADISGPREIIIDNENGLLVQPTVEGLSAGLKRLSENKALRKNLGEKARITVLKRFDKKKLMEAEMNSLLNFK